MEPLIQMNKFEVVDMPGMTTLAFVVEKSDQMLGNGRPMLTLQKIECIDSEVDGRIKKTFSLVKVDDNPQLIILLTLTNNKAILSTGELSSNGFKPTESNVPLSYGSIYNQEGIEYKEVEYTPSMKRHFSIIDTQTGEEVRPILYTDEETGMIKGKCKLLPHRPYIVLELKYED